MRAILQRVSEAEVLAAASPSPGGGDAGVSLGRIGRGVLVLLGIERGDSPAVAEAAAERVAHLRLFDDAAGRMNLDAAAVGGAFLVVSQFTLAGEPLARGRRPSFDAAAPPEAAEILVDRFVARLRSLGHEVSTGRFRSAMRVRLVNEGPATFVVDVPVRRNAGGATPAGSADQHRGQGNRRQADGEEH